MKNSSDIIKPVDPQRPRPGIIRKAAEIIRDGGVVVFPTSCLYGIGADARNAGAVERIFSIKKRQSRNPILVLIHEQSQLGSLVKFISPMALLLMERLWPGNITFIFDALLGLPEALTAGTGKIGVRLCKHPVARALCKAVDAPLTGTSANLSGRPGSHCVEMLPRELIGQVEMVLDAGSLTGGAGSSIVDVTRSRPVILREGAVPALDIVDISG